LALYFQGVPLQDKDKLNQKGIKEGELLYMTVITAPIQQTQPKPKINIADMIKNFDKNRK
jgi:hypothetical protein